MAINVLIIKQEQNCLSAVSLPELVPLSTPCFSRGDRLLTVIITAVNVTLPHIYVFMYFRPSIKRLKILHEPVSGFDPKIKTRCFIMKM